MSGQDSDTFWLPIVRPNGEWDHDQIMRELHDYKALLHSVPLVYDHATGGRVSKPNTDPTAVIAEIDDHIDRLCAEDAAALARSEAAHTAAYNFIDRLRDEHIIDFGEKLTDDLRDELLALLAASDSHLEGERE